MRNKSEWAIVLGSANRSDPLQVSIHSEDFLEGAIYMSDECFNYPYTSFPLRYPVAEVIMINLLSRGRGVLLHACGIIDQGRGVLFLGRSGDGKSTTAKIWNEEPDVTVLSDDRIILRKEEDYYRIYGTPWHGTYQASSHKSVPLTDIFLIKHGDSNHIEPIDPIKATTMMFERSFPPLWHRAGLGFTLDYFSELSQRLDCHELSFKPDSSMVATVRESYQKDF